MTIAIYQSEIDAGLRDDIASRNSLAYHAPVATFTPTDTQMSAWASMLGESADKSWPTNANERDIDLFFVKSILVTSCWNLNDDVFSKAEVWTARHTPEDKPTNLGHDENQIVGHITGNWAIDEDGTMIDEDTSIDNLPDLYHILNSSVVYKHWNDPELVARAQTLIEQIESGEKFVSMECLFSGFDYAVTVGDENHVVQRDAQSAFLTKHLRAYGGTGEFEGMRVGRLLRHIVFSGKGFVDKPANPDSIIFTDKNKPFVNVAKENSLKVESGVSISCGTPTFIRDDVVQATTMNPNWIVYTTATNFPTREDKKEKYMSGTNETVMKDLKDQVTTIVAERDELKKQLAKINVEKYEAQIADLTTQRDEAIVARDEAFAERDARAVEVTDATSQITELTASITELQTKLDEVAANEKRVARIVALTKHGLTDEDAEARVDEFVDLTDAQFDSCVKLLEGNIVQATEEVVDESDDEITDDETAEETDASEETLEDVTTEDEPDLSTANDDTSDEDNELTQARAGLLDFIGHYVSAKKSDK